MYTKFSVFFDSLPPPCLHLSDFLEPPLLADIIFGLTPPQVVPALLFTVLVGFWVKRANLVEMSRQRSQLVEQNQFNLKSFLNLQLKTRESRSLGAWPLRTANQMHDE